MAKAMEVRSYLTTPTRMAQLHYAPEVLVTRNTVPCWQRDCISDSERLTEENRDRKAVVRQQMKVPLRQVQSSSEARSFDFLF